MQKSKLPNKNIFIRFLTLVVVYSGLRLLFFAYNYRLFAQMDNAEIISAFVQGWRFDLSVIVIVNGLFFAHWLWPIVCGAPLRIFDRLVDGLFVIVNTIFVAMNVADAELIHFNGKRLTLGYFRILSDIGQQSTQLMWNYWSLFLVILVAMVLFWWVGRRTFELRESCSQLGLVTLSKRFLSFGQNLLAFLVFAIFVLLSIRGGLQNKPLKEAHAFVYQSVDLGHLTLNSTFTFLQSYKRTEQKPVHFYSAEEMIKNLSKPVQRNFSSNGFLGKKNIFIIILESFASEYIGYANGGNGYTPFFDELAAKGLYFHNAYANGRRSIEAIPAILASVPSLLNEAFLTSSYQATSVKGIGDRLGPAGYATAFYHGAENGTMFFDSFTRRIGIQNYFGLKEYPDPSDYDGTWGVFDEPYFQYVAKQVSSLPQPFAVTLFSLSSHQPFKVPEKYRDRFKKGTHPIHEAIGYTDFALGQFFAEAEKQSWFKDTIFIITGDHTSLNFKPEYNSDRGVFRVPLLIYSPSITWPNVDLSKPVQHIDILPTVLDILDLQKGRQGRDGILGSSVFDRPDHTFVVNRVSDGFWYQSASLFLKMDNNHRISGPTASLPTELKPHEARLKSFLQYFIDGVLNNSLTEN